MEPPVGVNADTDADADRDGLFLAECDAFSQSYGPADAVMPTVLLTAWRFLSRELSTKLSSRDCLFLVPVDSYCPL